MQLNNAGEDSSCAEPRTECQHNILIVKAPAYRHNVMFSNNSTCPPQSQQRLHQLPVCCPDITSFRAWAYEQTEGFEASFLGDEVRELRVIEDAVAD